MKKKLKIILRKLQLFSVKLFLKYLFFQFIIFFLKVIEVKSQFTIYNIQASGNANALVNELVGSGIQFFNATFTGSYQGTSSGNAGFFMNGLTTLGIDEGIVLTTGQAGCLWDNQSECLASPNTLCYFSTNNNLPGDPLLDNLSGSTTYNAAVLTFDFIPESDYIQFRYVFGSDEYDEYVGDIYNDIFGFFITSLEADGYGYNNYNLALIPGTNSPVSINTVNKGNSSCGTSPSGCTNCAYYVSNVPSNVPVEYDGLTTVLTASCNVTPCKTYRLKIAIADVGDAWYDSGVFLEKNSLVSPIVQDINLTFSNPNVGGGTSAVEGCSNAFITFNLNFPTPNNRNVNISLGGTATFGVDYYTIPDISNTFSPPNNYYVTIPAGQSSTTLTIVPILDGNIESIETITYTIQTHLCDPGQNVSGTINIIDNSTQFYASLPSTTDICIGESTTLQVSVNGGQAPFTYQWNSGHSGQTITINPSTTTTYIVTVTDGCGASTTASTTVYVNPIPNVSSFPPSVNICNGENTNITLTSNVPNAQFNWTASGSNNAIGYSSGSGNQIIQNLQTTDNANAYVTYTVIANANECYSPPLNIDVTIYPSPSITNINVNGVTVCEGTPDGSITVEVQYGTPPYQFSLNNGPYQSSNSFYNLSAGSYDLTVIDNNGCQATYSNILVPGSTGVSIDSIDVINVTCYGGNNGSLTIHSSNAVLYSIDNGLNFTTNNFFSGLYAGVYSVVVKDNGNCIASEIIQINQPPDIIVYSTIQHHICDSFGLISLSIDGGTPPYTIQWNTGSSDTIITNITEGTYFVTITDANNCIKTYSYQIDYIPSPHIDSVKYTNITCYGLANGSITIYASNASFYSINNGEVWTTTNTFTNLPSASYQIVVKNNLGCTDTFVVEITQPTPIVSTINTTPQTCTSYGTAEVIPSGGTPPYQFNWSTGDTSNAINKPFGTYSITITDANNCTNVFNVVIDHLISTPIVTYSTENVKCYGESSGKITLNLSNVLSPYQIHWAHTSDTSHILTNLPAGAYYVTVIDKNGCSVENTIYIAQPSQIVAQAFQNELKCYGDTNGYVVIYVEGGTPPYEYHWSNEVIEQHYIVNIGEGMYFVTITDANSCSRIYGPFIFNTPPPLTVNTIVNQPKCYNELSGSITSFVNGGITPYTFYWSTGDTLPSINNLPEGIYFVTITDKNGCKIIASDTIKYPPNIAIIGNVSIFEDRYGSIDLTVYGGTPPYYFQWSNGTVVEDPTNLGGGYHYVTVTDYYGCKATAVFFIDIQLKIPNVITPNNDNINDNFEIIGIQAFNSVIIEIYDRWGNLVFDFKGTGLEYMNEEKRWNGKFKGEDLPPGPYLYIIKLDNRAPIIGYVSIIY